MDSNQHLLVVINPNAGVMDQDERLQLVEQLTNAIEKRGWTYTIFKTTGEKDAEAILKMVREELPQRVIISGGDGTINLVAHSLKDQPIVFGVLPSGSANGLAFNLKLPDTLEAQIEVALGDDLMDMDHLIINDHSCLHIADLGLNAELIHNFEDSRFRGKLGYILQSIPTLIQTDGPFAFKIDLEGTLMERSGILLAIANARNYGTGATINPNGKMDDGRFEVLVFKELNTIEILKTLYDQADLSTDFAESFTTKKVIISTDDPVAFQIDGEPMGKTTKVTASLYPKRLSFAVSNADGNQFEVYRTE